MKQKLRWVLPAAAVVLSLAAGPAMSQSIEIVDFEDHEANPTGTPGVGLDPDFYARRGVHFAPGATVLSYDGGFASSGRNGLEMCYSAEFCSAPFGVGFDDGQMEVTVNIGFSGTLDAAEPVVMVALDHNFQRIAVAREVIRAGSDVPIDTPLVVTDPAGRIRWVEIRWEDAKRVSNSLAIDDLLFQPFVPFAELTTSPEPLVFGELQPGESVVVPIVITNTGNIDFSFFVTVEDPLGRFAVVGDTCDGGLGVGTSCVVDIRFFPSEQGEHAAEIVIRGETGAPLKAIPAVGSLVVPVATTTPATSAAPTTSASPVTAAPQTTVVATTLVPTTTGGTGSGSNYWWWLLAPVAASAGLVLVRLRRGGPAPSTAATGPTEGPTPAGSATLRVRPGEAQHEILPSRAAPVTAVRVTTTAATTTLIEERP